MTKHVSNIFPISPFLGVGLYTVTEASVITCVPSREISRWLFGYTSGSKGHKRHYSGLWQPQLSKVLDDKALSFHDLLEVRFVNAFRRHGVSLQSIRAASQHAQELFHHSYPFTCKRFQTDGRSIFATILEETHDETLLDLVKKQYVFKQVITPSLYEGIQYSKAGEANCWFPLGKNHAVVLDPRRSFGKPILTESGVSTAAIAKAYLTEGKSTKFVSDLFEIPGSAVESAIRFEHLDAA